MNQKADALQMQPSAFFLPMSYLVIIFAEITILFMEKTTILRRIGNMDLDIMIVVAMVLLMAIGGLWVKFLETVDERRRRRKTSDIWYRV